MALVSLRIGAYISLAVLANSIAATASASQGDQAVPLEGKCHVDELFNEVDQGNDWILYVSYTYYESIVTEI